VRPLHGAGKPAMPSTVQCSPLKVSARPGQQPRSVRAAVAAAVSATSRGELVAERLGDEVVVAPTVRFTPRAGR
jgi:hypothetical protein